MAQMQVKKKSAIWSSIVEFTVLLMIVFLIRTMGFGLYQVPTGSMETTMLVGERFFADKFTYFIKKPQDNDIIAFNDPGFIYADNKIVSLFQQYVWGPSNWTKRVIGIPGDHIRGMIEDDKPVIYRNEKKLDEPYLNKYPLIHVWKHDPEMLREQIETELEGVFRRSGQFDETVINRIMIQKWGETSTYRSYDPQVSFAQQPFYRIIPDRVIRGPLEKPELKEPGKSTYSPPDARISTKNYWNGSDEFSVTLGPGEYWVMGDNRRNSHDSRFFGPIKEKHIHGRIAFRIWSIDSDEAWWILDLLKHPIDFWQRIRWNRFFQRVH